MNASDICPGCGKPANCLRLHSTAVTGSSAKPKCKLSQFYKSSPNPGYSQEASGALKDTWPSKESTFIPSLPDVSNLVEPCHDSASLQGALSYAETLFIRSITAAEFVCGQRRYKCSGCLHYYDYLDCLLAHIQHGRMEGFSCRLFYSKLKSMQEHKHAKRRNRNNPQLQRKPAVLPAEGRKCYSFTDNKMDMIYMWLQTLQISAVPE